MPLPCRPRLLAVLVLAAAAAAPASASAASLTLTSTTYPPPPQNVPFTATGTADMPGRIDYLADPAGTPCAATYRDEQTRPNIRGMNGNTVTAAGSFSFENPGVPGSAIVCGYLTATGSDAVLATGSVQTSNSAAAPAPTGPGADSDGDHVYDANDACPTVPGSLDANGCPDADGDWIPDSTDACPNQAGAGEGQGTGCPDEDGDGVQNSEDLCKRAGGKDVDAHGCPPAYANIGLRWRSIGQMLKSGGQSVTCTYTHGVPCTFHVTLRLSAASARQLGVGRDLADKTFKTTGSSVFFNVVSGTWRWSASSALRAALHTARSVTFTYTASYRIGNGAAKKMPVGTFVLKRAEFQGYPPSITTLPGRRSVVGPGYPIQPESDGPR